MKSLDFECLGTAIAPRLRMIRTTGSALCFVFSHVGMVGDVRTQLHVQLLSQEDVADTVVHHLCLCFELAVEYICPQLEASVLHLLTKTKERSDKGKLTRLEAKFTNCLVQINTCNGRQRRDRFCYELSSPPRPCLARPNYLR